MSSAEYPLEGAGEREWNGFVDNTSREGTENMPANLFMTIFLLFFWSLYYFLAVFGLGFTPNV